MRTRGGKTNDGMAQKWVSKDGIPMDAATHDGKTNGGMPKPSERMMHMSCDDFLFPFQDLTENEANYASLFDSPVFAFLKQMHDRYGMTFSGYCFFEHADGSFQLTQTPAKFADDFRASSSWLKFAFHSRNSRKNYAQASYAEAKADYELVTAELLRITGCRDCLDLVPRMHNYAGSLDAVRAWKDANPGIIGLLTAEDSRRNYCHDEEQTAFLRANDRMYDAELGLTFFSTDLRLEGAGGEAPKAELEARLKDPAYAGRMNDLIIFLHDPNIATKPYQDRIIECCEFAVENGYRFGFPMDAVERGVGC